MPKGCAYFASWGKIQNMVLHGRFGTGLDWWFSKICGSGMDRFQFLLIRMGHGLTQSTHLWVLISHLCSSFHSSLRARRKFTFFVGNKARQPASPPFGVSRSKLCPSQKIKIMKTLPAFSLMSSKCNLQILPCAIVGRCVQIVNSAGVKLGRLAFLSPWPGKGKFLSPWPGKFW